VRRKEAPQPRHTLDEATERPRKNYYALWKALVEVREDPTLPVRWGSEPKGSAEWGKARQHVAALRVLCECP